MVDLRQLVILSVALLVPTFLIMTRRESQLLAWVCFTAGINIFDTTVFVNLPAARVTGLLLIPYAVLLLPSIIQTRPGKALVGQYSYLIFLGLIFGFLFPWSDGGLLRTFNQTAPGRTLIYLLRTGADLSLAFFVARQVVKRKSPDQLIMYIIIGTSVAAVAGVLEFLTRVDLYGSITGLRALSLEFRMRGFNYEPRGLGLIAAHGMLLSLLLYSHRRSGRYLILTGLHALAFFLAGSTSALVAAALGALSLFLLNRRVRMALLALIVSGILALALLVATEWDYLTILSDNVQLRLTTERIERPPQNIIEELAFRMEIFDGPALLFLTSNLFYLFVGTGPGLVSLPATAYLPPSPFFAWALETGLNSPPTAGGLLELANAGLIGLALWLTICISSLQAFKYLSRLNQSKDQAWAIGRSAFAIAAAIYLMQVSALSAIWPIFIGGGIGAAYLARARRKMSRITVQPPLPSTNPIATI